jgi:hypothetical protein
VTERDLTGNIVRDSEPGNILADDKPTTKHTLSRKAKARQALRIAELTRQGFTVDRGGGLTVFWFGAR